MKLTVGRVTLSDRASAGVYPDQSGPEIEAVISSFFGVALEWERVLIPDDRSTIEKELRRLAEVCRCNLIITTGGTGPSRRDVTPEATMAVVEKELPGFGEAMRAHSFRKVPTAILSRATAGIYHECLIINLPGRPQAIRECLEILIPAIVEALDHITGVRYPLK